MRPARFLAPLLLVFLCSCKHEPTVIGKWTGQMFGQDANAEFKEDKTVTTDIKQGDMSANLSGTYEITPKVISVTFGKYKLKGVDDRLAALASTFFKPIVGKPLTVSYHFNSDDELAVTFQNKTDILKRAKEDQP